MARGFSPAYREYHSGPRWRARKAAHWDHPLTLKSCVVCGARRGERRLDMHELRYRTAGHGEARVMLDPPWWAVVPACAHPCHRWMITPLSRHPNARRALVATVAALALWAGTPVLAVAAAAVVVMTLPRIPEATALLFVLGFPVRILRWVARFRV